MSKLDEIKKARTKFEKAWTKYQKFGEDETMGGRNAYEDMASARNDFATAANMLLLLPIVSAAEEYKAAVANDESSDALWKWQSNLFEALKALD